MTAAASPENHIREQPGTVLGYLQPTMTAAASPENRETAEAAQRSAR